MGYFSDSLDFEKFFAKDLWSNLKKDPKRLILGVDPASTWAWNKVLGRDDKPLVDQMGGPYDGRVFSYGHGNGGVYDRAQAAGINTQSAQQNHDAAHLIAGAYAVGGLGNAGGNLFGAGGEGAAQPGLWEQGFGGKTNFSTGMPSTSTSATAGIPGVAGPVGGGTGASSAASMGPQEWAKLGMGLAGSGQQQGQQQQPAPQAPVRNMAQPQPVPTMGQKISGGLGRVSAAMFPVDPNTGMTADQIKQMQTNALMQMGLGMLGSSSRGAGFGEAAARGYGLAQGNVQGAMQQAYENAMANRAETRAVDREKRMDEQAQRAQEHQQWLEEHTLDREQTADERYAGERDYRMQQDKLAQDRWKAEQDAMAQWRRDQIAARDAGDKPPSGYRWNASHTGYEFIPGGPADPTTGQRTVKPTEYDKKAKLLYSEMLDSEKQYKEATGVDTSSLLDSALNSNPVTRIFTSSDYRKHEAAGMRWAQNFLYLKSGASAPAEEVRKTFVQYLPQPGDTQDVIDQKDMARAQAMVNVADANNLPMPAEPPPGGGSTIRKSVGGRNYVQINGQWYEDDGTTAGQ